MAVGSDDLELGRDLHDRPRYMTHEALATRAVPTRQLTSPEISLVTRTAQEQGLLASLKAGLVSGTVIFGLSVLSPRFRQSGVSVKTALVVTPMFWAFYFKSYRVIGNVSF